MAERTNESFVPKIRQAIKDSIYGQEHSWKNAASRWVADKLSGPEEIRQEAALVRLENIGKKFDQVWNNPGDRLEGDLAEWRSRKHQGNYQKLKSTPKGGSLMARFTSWSGVFDHGDYRGKLNRVDGHDGSDYFCVDIDNPLVGPNKVRRLAQVRLSGDQLLPKELTDKKVDEVKVGADGLEVHLNQFDRALKFADRTEAAVWYTAGTAVIDSHRPKEKRTIVSPHGPICEVKFLVSSSQPTWEKGAQSIEGASNWIKMHLGGDGKWVQENVADKWDRYMTVTGQTLENGDVRVIMKVAGPNQETKEMILPKVNLNLVLRAGEKLVDTVVGV